MKCLVIIDHKFEELEMIGCVDILCRGGIYVDVCGLSDKTITGSHGFTLSNLLLLSEIDYCNYDCLILPGGSHYKALENSTLVIEIIKYFYQNEKVIAAICAAPTILGRLGLLKNKKYTCFTSMNENFNGEFINKYCVTDGTLITSKSAAAAIDFGFEVLLKLTDVYTVNKIKEQIYY